MLSALVVASSIAQTELPKTPDFSMPDRIECVENQCRLIRTNRDGSLTILQAWTVSPWGEFTFDFSKKDR